LPVTATAQVVQGLPAFDDPNLIVGAEWFSDGGVYRLRDGLAIVQSVDFFPPLVEDAYAYGRIAAANAMGDLYAMGAEPRTALNIVGFPDDELPLELLGEILRGGAEGVQAAGAALVGGHSVRDAEVKYGLAVTGVVDPDRMFTNRRARPGDALVLTKPLGTGFITTAARADACPADVLAAAVASMVRLNADAAAAARAHGVVAATDVTGFGLANHAREMAEASDVTIALDVRWLPRLPGVDDLMDGRHDTRANATNRAAADPVARYDVNPDDPLLALLFDPQTSGGLLIAVDADRAEDLVRACRVGGDTAATVIGRVEAARGDRRLIIESTADGNAMPGRP
jgi:selenide,water dikinase